MSNLTELYEKYLREITSQNIQAKHLDYQILENHIPFLDQLDKIGNSCITVFDVYKLKHVYISEKYTQTFGYQSEEMEEGDSEFFDAQQHPDDLALILETGTHFIQFINKVAQEEKKNYKLLVEYRRKNSKGDYLRVIEQFQHLEFDAIGNMWLSLCVLDISPDQDLDAPFRSRLLNFKTGETFVFPPPKEENNLSLREKEVLELIAQGLISKQIADKLSISFHTVNTHRQRIIEKLNVTNTFEALRYAATYGLISSKKVVE